MKTVLLYLALGGVALSAIASGSVVAIEGAYGSWRLMRNGKPYFIAGGGGEESKSLLKEIGGNSFRTWGARNARRDLDEAAKYGHTVMIGFWLGHSKHGFSYLDKKALKRTEQEVLSTVAKIKDHPALLCYALGNEMELGQKHPKEMWEFINLLAKKVKALDPDHPVGTVVADMNKDKADAINKYVPELQYIGINSYGGALSVGRRWREFGGKIPYILTEYGPKGAWECRRSSNGLPLEWTSTRKADWYREVYERTILAEKDKWCLGGYVFKWGHKNEASPTWFGTMLPDGTKLEVVATLAKFWGGRIANRCPRISEMKVSKDALEEGESAEASVDAEDPEGDKIKWHWTLIDEGSSYRKSELGFAVTQGRDGAIVAGQGTCRVKVKLPGCGKYRLSAYCFDGMGNAAYANWPLVVKERSRGGAESRDQALSGGMSVAKP